MELWREPQYLILDFVHLEDEQVETRGSSWTVRKTISVLDYFFPKKNSFSPVNPYLNAVY